VKALFLIGIAAYIAFCGTLYFAGNGKDFNDPFVQVGGNVTPPEAAPVETPKAAKSSKQVNSKRPTNTSETRATKSKLDDAPRRTTWKTSRD
jgi:hypothetical protein